MLKIQNIDPRITGKKLFLGFLLIGILVLSRFSSAQSGPQHPVLFLSESDFQRIHRLAQQEPWARKQEQQILRDAEEFPASYETKYGLKGLEIPPEGGQWTHHYACPETGKRLIFHPPNQHICPDTGKVFKGFPYDQVVYTLRANDLGTATLNLALAFRLSANPHYSEEAANLLKEYADRYLSYPLHDNFGKNTSSGARVFSQTLDESIWLIKMTWAYDLLRGTDALTARDRQHIEQDFLRPAAAVEGRAVAPTYNWQAWDYTAVAAVGYALGDQNLVHQALDSPNGFRFQMEHYVIDGFWIEGSWGYQFYLLRALTQLAAMAMHNGTNLWKEEPNLQALLASPFGVMLPDGTLPPFNDSLVVNLYDQAPLYEFAYAATHNPRFASLVEQGKRDSQEALLFGAESLAHENPPPLTSEVYPDAGYATLRASQGDLTEIMKFGPHGEGHGHFDKLGEVIYAFGGLMSVDPGTQFYGVPTHNTWDKTTVAHNTVVVDETSQAAATGKLMFWQKEGQFTSVMADAGPVYKNVSLTRRVVLTSRYILEITNATSTDGREHTFDWVYHNYGEQSLSLSVQPWSGFPAKDGYQHLTQNRMAATDGSWQDMFRLAADDKLPARGMHLWMLGSAGTQIMSGDGLGPDLTKPVPYVMARRHGRSAEYIVLLEPFRDQTDITSFERLSATRYRVKGSGWSDTINIKGVVSIQHSQSH